MAALVAKSYQNLEQLCEPYSIDGKQYVKVRLNNGAAKVVRAYTKKEYERFYPEVKIIQPAKSQKEILGFGEKGFIWLFKGDTYAALDWFRQQPTQYKKMWGWYLPSDIEMPEPLPVGVTPVKLPWEAVCDETGNKLQDEFLVENIVAEYIYDAKKGDYLGEVGERLTDIEVTCIRKIRFINYYGNSIMYIFETPKQEQVIWTTTTIQDINENDKYLLTGTIKKLDTYRGQKQTTLKNCRIKKIEI